MSKVKYIIEVDKDDIDVFLNHMNERYIINEYNGEIAVCGRVLLSAFKTATPIPESDDAVSRQAVLEIFGYVMDYWKEHAIDVEPHEIKDALIEQYEFTAKQLSELPPVTPKCEHGKWIGGICNKCHYDWSLVAPIASVPEHCPRCGMKMRGD